MNRIEEVIARLMPGLALRRARSRLALDHVRAYEAAAKGRRTDGWKTANSGAKTETKIGLLVTRARARDLVRNNPYASKAIAVISSNLVGYGIKTTPQSSNKKTSPKMLQVWQAWAESTDCDFDGNRNMYGLQELAARTIPESGEVLVRRRWRKAEPGKIPMQIQVLEPDFIDTSKDGKNGKNIMIQGIEYDSDGRKLGYWLFESHPGDGGTSKSNFVRADDVIHTFRIDRPGQVRGITWFAPVVIRLRDFDEYEDAQLVRQKIAACFTAFVYDSEGGSVEGTSQGAGAADDLLDRMEPALIQRLGPGQNVTLASPPGVQGYGEYSSVTLHGIAAGIGIPYESLTGDFSRVNFSSMRMSKSEFHSSLDTWQWNMFIPSFCGGIWSWFIEAATLAGMPTKGVVARYTPPRRNLVDPTREIPALIRAVRGGMETLPNAIRSMGYEPEDFYADIAATNAELDRLGITLDSDPRKVSAAGLTQARAPGSEIPSDGTDSDAKEGSDETA